MAYSRNCNTIGHSYNANGKCVLCGKLKNKCYGCGRKASSDKVMRCNGCDYRLKVSAMDKPRRNQPDVITFYRS